MKKGILFSVTVGAAAFLTITLVNKDSENQFYQPRESVVQNDNSDGYMNFLMNRMADRRTGKINPADVSRAYEQAGALKAKKSKSSALGLVWSNMGPDDLGGRTRAVLVDKDDSQIIYAGGVSGGLFKSTTGGSSWSVINDKFDILSVSSIAQASNGDIYFGTGEGLYYFASGDRGRGIIGRGIWKSVDGGTTFNVIPTTVPVVNNANAGFAAVGKLATDPTNSDRIYACTRGGFMVSDDAGDTWTKGLTTSQVSPSLDLAIAPNGAVWMKEGNTVYKSPNGDVGSFVAMTGLNKAIPSNGGRMRIAVSPQDANYVYITTSSGGTFNQAWQTKDGGDTWTKIGQASSQLNPLASSTFSQALAVSPIDKERILFAGLDVIEWTAAGGWAPIATRVQGQLGPSNPFYVHADNHNFVFDPKDGNTVYLCNDGGVFKSTNGGITWSEIVKQYITSQFYNFDVGYNGDIYGGTQDNGTIYISPSSPQKQAGVRSGFINFRGTQRDGDGGFASISRLNPGITFKAMQNGIIGRSIDGDVETNDFVLSDDVDPNLIAGSGSFANFVTPFKLWEKLNDPFSKDSILFSADTIPFSLGLGSGASTYTGTVVRKQASSRLVPEGLEITAGFLKVTSLPDGTLTGDGTGNYVDSSGTFSVTFSQPVSIEIRVKAAVRYEAGDTVILKSAINELPIVYGITQNLNPGESVMIQDPVQSMFVVGVVGLSAGAGAFDANEDGGIWMTRGALSNINLIPQYFHIGKIGVGVSPSNIEISADGDQIWVGTETGNVFRFANLKNARDSADMSVDDGYVSGVITTPNTSLITKRVISLQGVGSFRTITDIAINPSDPDKVVITVGNYGSQNYVFYSNNGTSANPTFTAADGDLPSMPVYSATFNYRSANTNELIIGTDIGIFTTDDISAGSNVTWTQENDGMANVAVFDLIQDRVVRFDLKEGGFDGAIYAGTHGRGIFKTTSTSNFIGEEEHIEIQEKEIKGLNIYPNPAVEFIKVGLELENTSDVIITVRDITGKLVKSQNYRKLSNDIKEIELNVSSLKKGSYLITVQTGAKVESAKFIVN